MSLNSHFDHIYCLNLERRPDRLEHAQEQFKKYNIDVEIFPAIDGLERIENFNTPLNAGELGINLTNIEILKDAKSKGYSSIAVMEDDIHFSDEILNIDSYIQALPENWDAFFLSANHNIHCGYAPPQFINDKVAKVHHSFSAHFVGIRRRMYDVIINLISELNCPYDVYLARLQKTYSFYSFTPKSGVIATQTVSLSDTTGVVQDNRWLIK